MKTALKLVILTQLYVKIWSQHLDCGDLEEEHICGNFCDLNENKLFGFEDGDCMRGCICKKGYIRNAEGFCEPVENNHKWLARCQANENFVKCSDGCEETCDGRKCNQTEDFQSGCLCKTGTYRTSEGTCVEVCDPKISKNETHDSLAHDAMVLNRTLILNETLVPNEAIFSETLRNTVDNQDDKTPDKGEEVLAEKNTQNITENSREQGNSVPSQEFDTKISNQEVEVPKDENIGKTEMTFAESEPQKISDKTSPNDGEVVKVKINELTTNAMTTVAVSNTKKEKPSNKLYRNTRKLSRYFKTKPAKTRFNQRRTTNFMDNGDIWQEFEQVPDEQLENQIQKAKTKSTESLPNTTKQGQIDRIDKNDEETSSIGTTTTVYTTSLQEISRQMHTNEPNIQIRTKRTRKKKNQRIYKQEPTTRMKTERTIDKYGLRNSTNREMESSDTICKQEISNLITKRLSNEKLEITESLPAVTKQGQIDNIDNNDLAMSSKGTTTTVYTTSLQEISTEMHTDEPTTRVKTERTTTTTYGPRTNTDRGMEGSDTTCKQEIAIEITKSQLYEKLTTETKSTEPLLTTAKLGHKDNIVKDTTTTVCTTSLPEISRQMHTDESNIQTTNKRTRKMNYKRINKPKPKTRVKTRRTTISTSGLSNSSNREMEGSDITCKQELSKTELPPTTKKEPTGDLKHPNKALREALMDIKEKFKKLSEAAQSLNATWTKIYHKEKPLDLKTRICLKHRSGDIKIFRHPKSCTHFYQCHLGKAMLRKCPDGLHYDEHTHTCKWPEEVKCNVCDATSPDLHNIAKYNNSLTKSKSELCRKTKRSFLWDNSSCRRFWKCEASGMAREMECKHGQHFDMRTETCRDPKKSDCRRRLLTKSRPRAEHLSAALLSHFVSHH